VLTPAAPSAVDPSCRRPVPAVARARSGGDRRLRGVQIEDGIAYVDLGDITWLNNANTSCGGTSFMSQLRATAVQFPPVDEAVFAIEGDPEPFYTWQQSSCPDVLSTNGACDASRFLD
jgi:hypothetical protein